MSFFISTRNKKRGDFKVLNVSTPLGFKKQAVILNSFQYIISFSKNKH